MKYITKTTEPQIFTEWKRNDKMFQRGRPLWDRVTSTVKNVIRESLAKDQGYICCYCERTIRLDDSHPEHIKPQEYFHENQLDYDNLLCSCQLLLEKKEPRHCGMGKGSWYNESEFISPLDPDCETKFKYTHDGHIEPVNENDLPTIKTIDKLSLDIDRLVALRAKVIEAFTDPDLSPEEIKSFVDGYLIEKNNNNGIYNQFYTTIKYLFKK